MIDVLLVGDVRLNREGIAAMLRRDGRVRVSATSESSDEIATKAQVVDVVVIDTTAESGVSSAAVTAAAVNKPAVVFGLLKAETVIGLAEAGVMGFVNFNSGIDELVAGIEAAARREAWCPQSIATLLLERIKAPPIGSGVRGDLSPLTTREHQIVGLIAEGLTNKEIARRLSIEVATVKNHVHNILEKLQVRRRADAAAHLRLVEGTTSVFDARERSRAGSGIA